MYVAISYGGSAFGAGSFSAGSETQTPSSNTTKASQSTSTSTNNTAYSVPEAVENAPKNIGPQTTTATQTTPTIRAPKPQPWVTAASVMGVLLLCYLWLIALRWRRQTRPD